MFDEIADDERENHRKTVDRIIEFQKRMREKYGVIPDSGELIREGKMR